MEQLLKILEDLEKVTFDDISEIPEEIQHLIVLGIEELQDNLRCLSGVKSSR